MSKSLPDWLEWHAGEPLLAPQEILVHILNLKKDACPLKQHMAALTSCLTMKLPDGAAAFPSQSLALTLQQLVVRCVFSPLRPGGVRNPKLNPLTLTLNLPNPDLYPKHLKPMNLRKITPIGVCCSVFQWFFTHTAYSSLIYAGGQELGYHSSGDL